ncbi:MAG: NERD domain-containing protein [Chloroflexota bacterium]|nr:NERD domain-containing protein [Chloroflexota bacterium]
MAAVERIAAGQVDARERGPRRQTAEQFVAERVRAALPSAYRVYPNVRWISRSRPNAPARDGETDLLIAHPDDGLLVVETKGGQIRRDTHGRWYSGNHLLEPAPFEQAERSKHALVDKLRELPDWPSGLLPPAGHAVAFPDVDLRSLGSGARLLGPDSPDVLVLDCEVLARTDSTMWAIQHAYDYWLGDGHWGAHIGERGIELIDRLLAPTFELRSLLRAEVEEGEREVVALTEQQMRMFNWSRNVRRAAIVGCAGSGKTLLAAEKARRFAAEGFRTLLVCFNQPLARMLREHLSDAAAPAGLDVLTFHELCLRLGRNAGALPPEPLVKDQPWFDDVLPRALDQAIQALDLRYHAIIVDEAQDFEGSWLLSLDLLLSAPGQDVFYVFHDPSQALYRPDLVGSLDLQQFPVLDNCRNPGPVHELAKRFYTGEGPIEAWRESGRRPELIEAEPGRPTLEALRKVLHWLTVEEGIRPWQIAVLTGVSLEKSDVWRQRRFGNQVLWNGNYDDAGRSLGRAVDAVPEQPSDTILCDSIRRFKGLEREIIVLVELRADVSNLDPLLYVGITRARQHLVVIAPEEIAGRLR